MTSLAFYLCGSLILLVVCARATVRARAEGEPWGQHLAFTIASGFFVAGGVTGLVA